MTSTSRVQEVALTADEQAVPGGFGRDQAGAVDNDVRGWVGGSIVQARMVQGDVHIQSASQAVVVPRQLPAAVPHFVGRDAELARLTSLLEPTDTNVRTVVISAIDGTAGIGKTALAMHWAHDVADQFPDGQLCVNLRGFEPSGSAMTAAEAVRGFLDALEVSPERIPVSLEAQAALYRSLIAGRRVLVILDNAHDADQVRPLLPGSAECAVVITSRNRLTSLLAVEGAHPLTLDVLTAVEARQLLLRRLGSERIATEPHAAEEVISLCARLPLALSIVAARTVVHPTFPLAAIADELRSASPGLVGFESTDVAANIRAVFSWSYQQLSPAAAQAFRLLGLHPGPDISLSAAASLTSIPALRLRPILTELTSGNLLIERTSGRFSFHDLLHVYAAELASILDSEPARHEAVERLLDHYLHTAHAAALIIQPRQAPITLSLPSPRIMPDKLLHQGMATTWFDTEHAG